MALPLAQQQSIFAWGGNIPSTPEDILARYLHLREISKKVHEEVLRCISADALLNHAGSDWRKEGRCFSKTWTRCTMSTTLPFTPHRRIVRGRLIATRSRPGSKRSPTKG